MIIRNETPADYDAITEVTAEAFLTLAISQHTEQFIIQALRAAGALTISLVAEIDGQVVGHIAFSPITISDGTPNWQGSGPGFRPAPLPAAGHRQGADCRRACPAQSHGQQRLRSGRPSGILQDAGFPKHPGPGSRRCFPRKYSWSCRLMIIVRKVLCTSIRDFRQQRSVTRHEFAVRRLRTGQRACHPQGGCNPLVLSVYCASLTGQKASGFLFPS